MVSALQSELWQLVKNNPEVVAEAAEKLECTITWPLSAGAPIA